jgi:ribose-phosphate pyrophosphokinase
VALKERGARDIYACVTHPVFLGPSAKRLNDSPIREIIVTDTIPLNQVAQSIRGPKITVLSVAPLFGEAIRRIHKETSVSSLLR